MLTTLERRANASVELNEVGRDLVLLTWPGGGSAQSAAGEAEEAVSVHHAGALSVTWSACPCRSGSFCSLHVAPRRGDADAIEHWPAAGAVWPVARHLSSRGLRWIASWVSRGST